MCKESLIQYLLNTSKSTKDIEAFIRFPFCFSFLGGKGKMPFLLNQNWMTSKFANPAMGSGAFPMVCCNEIFEAKTLYLSLPENQPRL